MAKGFRVRLMRVVSHETDVVVEASDEEKAKKLAMEQCSFLIWEHRNRAEYEVLTVRQLTSDEEETKSEEILPLQPVVLGMEKEATYATEEEGQSQEDEDTSQAQEQPDDGQT